jgi:hypothetical protein
MAKTAGDLILGRHFRVGAQRAMEGDLRQRCLLGGTMKQVLEVLSGRS